MQVNNYQTMAEYTADATRSKTASAVSKIVEGSVVLFDGVNVVFEDKNLAGVGDIVCKDVNANKRVFVKAGTVKKSVFPANLKPYAEVCGRVGDKVIITAIENLASARWAHSFEVAVNNVNPTIAGTLAIVVHNNGAVVEEVDVNWAAGATLESIATSITNGFKQLADADNKTWSASAVGTQIILSHNYYLKDTVDSITGTGGGSGVSYVQDEHNWQIEYAYLKTTEQVRRKNGVDSYFAGGNKRKFWDYHRANGTAPTSNIPLGSSTIVNEDAFNNSEFCADLRAKYPDYLSYLLNEHFIQFPSAFGAMLRNGKETTALLASLKGTTVRGADEPRYPAAFSAFNYRRDEDPELEWWLPGVDEMTILMTDRRLRASDVATEDPFNDTAVEMGFATAYGEGYYPWTSCECTSNYAFLFNGYYGYVGSNLKYHASAVRPFSAL